MFLFYSEDEALSFEMVLNIHKATQCYVPDVSDLLAHMICKLDKIKYYEKLFIYFPDDWLDFHRFSHVVCVVMLSVSSVLSCPVVWVYDQTGRMGD
jgi:hypothetical protein